MQRESRIYKKDWPFNRKREEWVIIVKSIINQPSDDIHICYSPLLIDSIPLCMILCQLYNYSCLPNPFQIRPRFFGKTISLKLIKA